MTTQEESPQTFTIGGLPYQAWAEPDLAWLSGYGQVFRVMDRQAPAFLLFGVDGPYGRLLIKYAGARTVNYRGKPTDAVFALRKAMSLYQYEHPALLRLLAHGPAGDGYAAIFPWRGDGFLRSNPPDPAVRTRVRHLSIQRSLKMLDSVFDLHQILGEEGYIAGNFSDSSLLIDFERDEAIVWDIDQYRRKPAANDKGRLRGSSRFMAPEEYVLGAPLDESTTVYSLGALAFTFFGDEETRAQASWSGPPALYAVARRAVSESKSDRFPSVRSFLNAWRKAVGQSRLH